MCKRILFLLLPLALLAQPASADPLRITSGAFLFDIEGDTFTFHGSGFALATTEVLHLHDQYLSRPVRQPRVRVVRGSGGLTVRLELPLGG